MNKTAKITMFGKTKKYPIEVYVNGKKTELNEYEKVLWVESATDWYAFSSPEYKNKKVLIVKRDTWIRCKEVIEI